MLGSAVVLLGACWLAQSNPATQAAGDAVHHWVAVSESDQISESSGVIASRVNKDVYWTHNDSGDLPRVWAFRLSEADRRARKAKNLGYIELEGASNVDWEDIAAGPGKTIYILDGGDNPPCDRTDKRIHRFTEPKFDVNGPPIDKKWRIDSIRWEYPGADDAAQPAKTNDERFDAECLFVLPKSGDIYIVTKRNNKNIATSRVFKIPGSIIRWNTSAPYVLTFVQDISRKIVGMVTGGDIDRSGKRVLIRNYVNAYEFTLGPDMAFDDLFNQKPAAISLFGEPQGEGICYTADRKEILSTAEVRNLGGRRFPVYITSWPDSEPALTPHTHPAAITE